MFSVPASNWKHGNTSEPHSDVYVKPATIRIRETRITYESPVTSRAFRFLDQWWFAPFPPL